MRETISLIRELKLTLFFTDERHPQRRDALASLQRMKREAEEAIVKLQCVQDPALVRERDDEIWRMRLIVSEIESQSLPTPAVASGCMH